MQYLGGKSAIGREIAEIIKSYAFIDQTIYEPFCGAANVTQYLAPYKVEASDIHKSLILCLQAVQQGWLPPTSVSEQEYKRLQNLVKEGEESALLGFVGFACSWGGKWFDGYARGHNRNYAEGCQHSLLKRIKKCTTTTFTHKNYRNLKPSNSVVYCDPPYRGTTGYGGVWCPVTFWETMRQWSRTNKVLISEYTAPDDFKIIASFSHDSMDGLASKTVTEHLFKYGG
jgi:DNA adenine methylase